MSRSLATKSTSVLKTVVLACVVSGCSIVHAGRNADFQITHSRFLGSAWGRGQADASIVSQDGGFSYAVPGGSLWWFGDTFKGSRDEQGKPHFAGGAVSCAVALLKANDTSGPPALRFWTGPDGTVGQAIPFLPDESWDHHRIWPVGGVFLHGKSYIFYALIELGTGTWDFKSIGSGLAVSAQRLGRHERIQTAQGWRFPVAPASILATEDWVYLYDVAKRNDRQGVWLSRVRPAEIEDPNAYQFHTGPGPIFSHDKSKEVLLVENIYGQTSVVWNEYLRKYLLAASSDFLRPRGIRFLTADEPFGPWTETGASVTVPEYQQGKKVELVYCSYLHPELFRENGRIMTLTFSLHLADSGFDANNGIVEVELTSP